MKRSPFWQIDEQEFRDLALSCVTITEFFEKTLVRYKPKSGYGAGLPALAARVQHLGLSDHFSKNKKKKRKQYLKELDTITHRGAFRDRLLRDKLIEYRCEICGNKGQWMDQPLTLQLDHRNGDGKEHTIENVRFLCPNCHSQTETWGGRNVGKHCRVV
jgi:predicted RNA-binding Zn-ribbon protein involved in translation (DUF1610 family)